MKIVKREKFEKMLITNVEKKLKKNFITQSIIATLILPC